MLEWMVEKMKAKSIGSILSGGLRFIVTTYGLKILLTVAGFLIIFILLYPVLFVVLTPLIRGRKVKL